MLLILNIHSLTIFRCLKLNLIVNKKETSVRKHMLCVVILTAIVNKSVGKIKHKRTLHYKQYFCTNNEKI